MGPWKEQHFTCSRWGDLPGVPGAVWDTASQNRLHVLGFWRSGSACARGGLWRVRWGRNPHSRLSDEDYDEPHCGIASTSPIRRGGGRSAVRPRERERGGLVSYQHHNTNNKSFPPLERPWHVRHLACRKITLQAVLSPAKRADRPRSEGPGGGRGWRLGRKTRESLTHACYLTLHAIGFHGLTHSRSNRRTSGCPATWLCRYSWGPAPRGEATVMSENGMLSSLVARAQDMSWLATQLVQTRPRCTRKAAK